MKLSWQAEEIIRAVRGNSLHEQTWHATGVAIDNRAVKPGDLFIALKGPVHDGHDFVGQAFANGAVAAIVDHAPPQVTSQSPLIFVEDSFSAMQDLGRVGRQRSHAKFLAVTGSVGKTSCKEQLRIMLGACGDVYANEGSFNNHWGVPLSLARLPADAKWGVFEIGMNHAGEITPLTREVKPAVSLINNVESVHLENFPSVEAIADAKAEIFLGMEPDSTAVLNRDNPHFARLLAAARTQGIRTILSFGQNEKADARLIECVTDADGSNVTADVLGNRLVYRIGTPGLHTALNSLGTLASAAAAGGDLMVCAEALAAFRPLDRRGARQKVQLRDGSSLTVVDETFNANPVSTKAAIRVLADIPLDGAGRRIAVLGDMKELGPAEAEMHVGLAEILIACDIDKIYCCGELMTHLYNALPTSLRGGYTLESAACAAQVAASVQNGDVVMVKGSKSVHMERVVEALKALDCQSSPQKMARSS